MTLKSRIRRIIEELTGRRILRNVPHGVDLELDIQRLLPGYRVETIVDVGANVGQSAQAFLSSFPGCQLYCCEPVAATFAELRYNVGSLANVHCFRLALSAEQRRGKMACKEGSSDQAHLVDAQEGARPPESGPVETIEEVEIDTLADFCGRNRIETISLLKIDTEGHDLDVLKGAPKMLEAQAIDLVQVEAGMNAQNRRHVPMEVLKSYLEGFGYFLFGLYEQVNEWPTDEPHLRRSNLLFLSTRMIQRFWRSPKAA